MPDTCETCRFWEMHDWCREAGGPPYVGTCYRNPPTLVGTEKQQDELDNEDPFYGVWPTSGIAAWCGEYASKDAPPADPYNNAAFRELGAPPKAETLQTAPMCQRCKIVQSIFLAPNNPPFNGLYLCGPCIHELDPTGVKCAHKLPLDQPCAACQAIAQGDSYDYCDPSTRFGPGGFGEVIGKTAPPRQES